MAKAHSVAEEVRFLELSTEIRMKLDRYDNNMSVCLSLSVCLCLSVCLYKGHGGGGACNSGQLQH